MPRWCRAPSAPLQLQSAVEQRCDLPQSVDADAHGSKFDRQGNAVKLAADFGKHGCVIVGHIGTMTGCGGSFHEQAHGGIAQRLTYAQPRSLGRPLQRDELENLLTLHQQRLSAGCQDADAGCPLVDILGKPGDDVDNVFATVEDEKQAAVAQKADDTVRGIGVMHDQAQRRSERAGDERRVSQRTEIEKMHMAIERRLHVMRQRDRDGRLADPAGASECNEAIAQQASRQFLQNVLASDHPLQAVWQRDRRGSFRDDRRW